MKLFLEQSDKEDIARGVFELVKPLLRNLSKENFRKIMNVTEVAVYLKVSEKWIYKRTYLKEIPYYKIDGQLRFKKQDIDAWLESHKIAPIPSSDVLLRAIKR